MSSKNEEEKEEKEEERKMEAAEEFVLNQRVKILPWGELSTTLNIFPDIVERLMNSFDLLFSHADILTARYGSDHGMFVDYLINAKTSIKSVCDACIEEKFSDSVIAELRQQMAAGMKYFDTSTRNNFPKFCYSLIENKEIGVQQCWIHIAEWLGRNDRNVQDVANEIRMTAYSRNEIPRNRSLYFLCLLEQRNVKVRELRKKIHQLESSEAAKNCFENVFKMKVDQVRNDKKLKLSDQTCLQIDDPIEDDGTPHLFNVRNANNASNVYFHCQYCCKPWRILAHFYCFFDLWWNVK